MTTVNRSAGTTATAAANTTTTPQFDVQGFMQNGAEVQAAKQLLGGENSSYFKNFSKNLDAAVAKLGANASEADVKKAASNEMFKQHIFKSTTDRMASKIMQKIKDMNSDGWA